ncbi:transcription factor bHLH18-like [Lycium ferocissimum]|uniref:transcription factor bHLH18-like n=1 Tax=Lycium ferocissimum TaxID=112874 RepID=UPI0028167FBD|nr:transcription factor bHLH18-like [Lycium ferocissimum]
MDISSAKWWTEMETIYTNDDTFVNHCQMMTQFDELPFSSCTYSGTIQPSQAEFCSSVKETQQKTFFPSSSSTTVSISFSNSPSATTIASKKYLQILNLSSVKAEVPSSEATINFSSDDIEDGQRLIQELGYGIGDNTQKKTYSRSSLQAQDHVLAERNRRERLTQKFIALSTLIPNLKKLNKASVLGDAIKYIKQLEEQVKTLEEEAKKYSEGPTVAVKRARIISNNGDSSSFGSEIPNISTDESFPDIEVRASNGNVLIRICCKKQNEIIREIFSQIEKLNLSIISTSVMPFGHNTTYITITAQMDDQTQLSMTTKNDANRIGGAIMKLIINGQEEAAFLYNEENFKISRSK